MADDCVMRFHYVNHRPRFTLRGVQVWPMWLFERGGHAQKLKGKTWRLSKKYADALCLDALRRSVLGAEPAHQDWWGPPEGYNRDWTEDAGFEYGYDDP